MKQVLMLALLSVVGPNLDLDRRAPAPAPIPRSYLILGRTGFSCTALASWVPVAGGTVTATVPAIGVVVAESACGGFAARVLASPAVEAVAPNSAAVRISGASAFFGVDSIGPEVDAAVENPPGSSEDDSLFNAQWGLDAIDAPEAWEAGHRGAGVRVAVLDTGMNPDHVDLVGRVNMALARSFIPGEGVDPRPLPPPPRPFAVAHGTFVAAIIGAADNGVGMIGVAPQVEIVPVKVLSATNGWGTWDSVIQGIVYAADIGADVINMSLGGKLNHRSGFDENGTPDPSDDIPLTAMEVQAVITAMSRATQYAHERGVTIIAARGNEAGDGDHDADTVRLPGDAPHVIAVASTSPRGWALDPTTSLDVPAPYSNYGQSSVDLAAPGGFADPTISGVRTIAGLTRPANVFDLVLSAAPAGNYVFASGTSFAAPHAAGVAALVIGKNGGAMDPNQVRSVLERSADDLGKSGNDDFFGAGRVNAYQAVVE